MHGDLKAANVLLLSSDQDKRGFIAKVSDFGLSRVLSNNRTQIKTQTFGTVTHMPPELLSKGILTASADVFAMGVLMWEAYSADRVFKHLSDSEVILAVVTRKARPVFPSDVPPRCVRACLCGAACMHIWCTAAAHGRACMHGLATAQRPRGLCRRSVMPPEISNGLHSDVCMALGGKAGPPLTVQPDSVSVRAAQCL